MADGLHEISQAIGRLQASDESSQRQRTELFKLVGDLREDMNRGFREIERMMAPLVEAQKHAGTHIGRHCEDLKAVNSRLAVFQSWLDKAKGASWATKAAIGAALVVVPAAFSYGAYLASSSHTGATLAATVAPIEQKLDVIDRRQRAYLPRSLVGPDP